MDDQEPQPQYPKYPGEGGDAFSGAQPPVPPSPEAEPERPQSISTAVRLMLVAAGLSFVSMVVGAATSSKDDVAEQVRDRTPDATQSEIDAAFAFGIVFMVVIGLIGVGLWLWMARKNGQGRSWARVVATVLFGLNAFSIVVSLLAASSSDSDELSMQTASPVSIALAVVTFLLALAILVLLWRKESSAYYDAVSRRRNA